MKKTIDTIIEEAFENPKKYDWVDISEISTEAVKDIKQKFNIDLSNYKFLVDTNAINHSWNNHGPKSGDTTPINKTDFLLIPTILSNYDSVALGGFDRKHKLQIIIFSKRIVNEELTIEFSVANEIRTGRKKLALQTFYRRNRRAKKKKPVKITG